MNTAAKPIMLCMKATNSGILVISTLQQRDEVHGHSEILLGFGRFA